VQVMGMLELTQTAVYELVGMQDGGITLRRTVKGQANDGVIKPSAMSQFQMKVRSLNAVGTDQIVLRRDRVMPQKQQSTVNLQADLEVDLLTTETTTPIISRTDVKLEANLESQ
jgi:hypothetical protein